MKKQNKRKRNIYRRKEKRSKKAEEEKFESNDPNESVQHGDIRSIHLMHSVK